MQKNSRGSEVNMKYNDKNSDEKLTKVGINWYPGHMAKTKRQIMEDLKLIDVVIELLDARIPLSSRNPDIDKIVANKKRIIALNKSDLADEEQNKKWVQYFKNKNLQATIIDSNSGKGIDNCLKLIVNEMKDELEKASSKGRIGKNIRVMIIGIPNVGKSSFINRISKKTSAIVGNRPGVTKQKQWIRIDNNIELLDTPGVLWPKFESEEIGLNLAYTGSIKDEVIDKVEVAFFLLKYLNTNYRKNLMERYKITEEEFESIVEEEENDTILNLMHLIGRKRGAIVSGGNVDETKVANIVLDDFRTSKLGKITLEKV